MQAGLLPGRPIAAPGQPSPSAAAVPAAARAASRILLHVHDAESRPPARRKLGGGWTLVAVPITEVDTLGPASGRDCLFDVDVSILANAIRVRQVVARQKIEDLRIFALRRGDRVSAIQADALNASAVIERPFTDRALLQLLTRSTWPGSAGGEVSPAAQVGAMALDLAFRSLAEGAPLAAERMGELATLVTDDIAEVGIGSWLDSIRVHHAGTYQHCLIVTGLATNFGQTLRFSATDMSTLTVAALLHDVGKARIDHAVLDKPGRLDEDELALIRMHPVWGEEHLKAQTDVPAAVLDAVRHHHEYLDGSGYPDGLVGEQIGDLTRLLTVADIFGALIEERSYKAPMPPRDAFAILRRMAAEGKLERALVEAFGGVVEALAEGRLNARQQGRSITI